jgi:competence protein ComEC
MRTGILAVIVALGLASCTPHRTLSRHAPPPVALDPRTSMRAHFIDVGQGDAILLEFPCAAMLVDLGAEMNDQHDGVRKLNDYLTAFFQRRSDLDHTLQLVVVTHPHFDHVQGVSLLLAPDSPYRVGNVLTTGLETSSGEEQVKSLHAWAEAQGIPLKKVTLEDIPPGLGLTGPSIDPIRCEAVDPEIRVLYSAPTTRPDDWDDPEWENINNHSLVIRIDFGQTSFLLLGDLELMGLGLLQRHMAGSRLLDADVLKVGHHGSWNATSGEFLQEVSPAIAVIMMGQSDREIPDSAWAYGHPRRDAVLKLLPAVSMRRKPPVKMPVAYKTRQFEPMWIERAVYGTGWDGTIVIEAGTDGKVRRVE